MRKLTSRIVVRIPAKVHVDFKKAAALLGTTQGFLLTRVIRDFLNHDALRKRKP